MVEYLYFQTVKILLVYPYNKAQLAHLVVIPVWFTWENLYHLQYQMKKGKFPNTFVAFSERDCDRI